MDFGLVVNTRVFGARADTDLQVNFGTIVILGFFALQIFAFVYFFEFLSYNEKEHIVRTFFRKFFGLEENVFCAGTLGSRELL